MWEEDGLNFLDKMLSTYRFWMGGRVLAPSFAPEPELGTVGYLPVLHQSPKYTPPKPY